MKTYAAPFIPQIPRNRQEKQILIKEFTLCCKLLEIECEVLFWNDLSTLSCSYEKLYAIYLEKFQQNIQKLRSVHKIQHIKLQDDYFATVYYPVEKS